MSLLSTECCLQWRHEQLLGQVGFPQCPQEESCSCCAFLTREVVFSVHVKCVHRDIWSWSPALPLFPWCAKWHVPPPEVSDELFCFRGVEFQIVYENMSLRLLVAVFFGTSTTVAALKCLGTVHVDKDRLKMFHQVCTQNSIWVDTTEQLTSDVLTEGAGLLTLKWEQKWFSSSASELLLLVFAAFGTCESGVWMPRLRTGLGCFGIFANKSHRKLTGRSSGQVFMVLTDDCFPAGRIWHSYFSYNSWSV